MENSLLLQNTFLTVPTPRLRLKVVGEDYAFLVRDYLQRNQAHFRASSPLAEPDFETITFHQRRLRQDRQDYQQGTQVAFWIFQRDEPEHIMGHVRFSQIVRGAFQSCFLGYGLDEQETGQGYASEALLCAIEYMFDHVRLHRIEANVMPSNTLSIRLLEKLQFQSEGLSTRYLKLNGVWEDHLRYALLNPREEELN